MSLKEKVQIKTTGILWITQDILNSDEIYFQELNYLSNNLIVKKIKSFDPNLNFFLTSNYDRPFFIAHARTSSNLKRDLENFLQITKSITPNNSDILIIGKDKKIKNYLASKRQDLNFLNYQA